jgi:hypothetical protein
MADTSVIEVRSRTRAAQHITSYPLLVVGVLFVNYGTVNFLSSPVEWRFAGALAFVVLWGLGKVNESQVGIGPARGDYLAIAAGVFTATQLTLLDPVPGWISYERMQGVWVAIVGAGLLALGLGRHERSLVVWGSAIVVFGVAFSITDYAYWSTKSSSSFLVAGGPQSGPIALLGALLTIVGLVTFERERRLA